jgi:hypothetical protein
MRMVALSAAMRTGREAGLREGIRGGGGRRAVRAAGFAAGVAGGDSRREAVVRAARDGGSLH